MGPDADYCADVCCVAGSTNSLQQDSGEVQVCEVSGLRPVKQSFACDICGHLYARPKMLEKHRQKHGYDVTPASRTVVHDSEKIDNVRKCPSESAGEPTMNHKESGMCDTGSKRYVCGECGEEFDKKSEVKSHMFAIHMCKRTLDFFVYNIVAFCRHTDCFIFTFLLLVSCL